MELEHIDFESNLRKMVGLTLTNVEYLEINYEPENPRPVTTSTKSVLLRY